MLKLTVVAGPDTGKIFAQAGETISIGRGEDCDVVLRDGAVSRRHCTIRRGTAQKFSLADLYTPNGTFLNDINNRVQTCDLHNGDEIILGKSWLRVEILDEAQKAHTAGANADEKSAPDETTGMTLPKNWQSGMTVVASRAQLSLLQVGQAKKKQEQSGMFAGLKRFFVSMFSRLYR